MDYTVFSDRWDACFQVLKYNRARFSLISYEKLETGIESYGGEDKAGGKQARAIS